MFMWAFDLIELNGDDLRREPLERRKSLARHGSCRAPACSSISTWRPRGRCSSSIVPACGEAHQASDWSRRCQRAQIKTRSVK